MKQSTIKLRNGLKSHLITLSEITSVETRLDGIYLIYKGVERSFETPSKTTLDAIVKAVGDNGRTDDEEAPGAIGEGTPGAIGEGTPGAIQ